MHIEQFVANLTLEQTELIKAYEFAKHNNGYLNFCSLKNALLEMEHYGYPFVLTERMIPVDLDIAVKLFHENCEIFLLFPDGKKIAAQEEIDIVTHTNCGGLLGITESGIEHEFRLAENYFLGEVL